MSLQEDEVRSAETNDKDVHTLSALLSGRREWLLFIVAIMLLVVLGYTVREVFSPIMVYVIFLVATYPLRHEAIVRHLILIATILFGVWFIVEVAGAVLPFVVAFIISFIFSPPISTSEKR